MSANKVEPIEIEEKGNEIGQPKKDQNDLESQDSTNTTTKRYLFKVIHDEV